VKDGRNRRWWSGGSPLDELRVVAPVRREMTTMIRERRRCVLSPKKRGAYDLFFIEPMFFIF